MSGGAIAMMLVCVATELDGLGFSHAKVMKAVSPRFWRRDFKVAHRILYFTLPHLV
jgi:hypothetical protein